MPTACETKKITNFFSFLIILLILVSQGCGDSSGYVTVDLSKTISVERPGRQLSEKPYLKVAVAAMISPKDTEIYYRQILDYLGDQMGRKTQLVQRKTYGEINALFKKGEVDVGFICSGPYAAERQRYGFEALATPKVRGTNFYQSYLIVNKNSTFQKLEDLRGRTFAFTDPDSNTGKLVPTYWLYKWKETPSSFFTMNIYTYSHDNSILAVARNLVDGATIDGHIWEYYNKVDPVNTSKTRIIKKSEPFGNPPVVASTYLPIELKDRIRQILFSMHENPKGQKILAELMIERFMEPKEEWYDAIRQMKQNVSQLKGITDANAKS
ncbi:MAG: phosphate/phosphite/phosphonate ABC transporter substrate-binding protein [Desulfobacterales bacterium]|nr:MAG: phosphate/phosphite/phosphonate ABC transporter substrate-binding protein [Desulfobacterales bacterium]